MERCQSERVPTTACHAHTPRAQRLAGRRGWRSATWERWPRLPRPAGPTRDGERSASRALGQRGVAASAFTKRTASMLHFPELGKRPKERVGRQPRVCDYFFIRDS